jgi:2-C-methyl-D-erythritol 4-phosphate cytidylyltransferase
MNAVVIVAGGSGRRMRSGLPKQYMDLKGKPLILHTIERFIQFDPQIRVVVVMARDHMKFWKKIAASYKITPHMVLASGGITRFDSVKNGLKHLDDGVLVGIHDAVRPLVNLETIKRCYSAAELSGGAIPVTEMDESVRMIESENRSVHMDRTRLKRVQTPQVFRSEMIKEAYRRSEDSHFTDDASVFESIYDQVALVEGNPENIKITTRVDFQLALSIMETEN